MRNLKIRLLALHKVTSEAVMYTNACSIIKHIEAIEAKELRSEVPVDFYNEMMLKSMTAGYLMQYN